MQRTVSSARDFAWKSSAVSPPARGLVPLLDRRGQMRVVVWVRGKGRGEGGGLTVLRVLLAHRVAATADPLLCISAADEQRPRCQIGEGRNQRTA